MNTSNTIVGSSVTSIVNTTSIPYHTSVEYIDIVCKNQLTYWIVENVTMLYGILLSTIISDKYRDIFLFTMIINTIITYVFTGLCGEGFFVNSIIVTIANLAILYMLNKEDSTQTVDEYMKMTEVVDESLDML